MKTYTEADVERLIATAYSTGYFNGLCAPAEVNVRSVEEKAMLEKGIQLAWPVVEKGYAVACSHLVKRYLAPIIKEILVQYRITGGKARNEVLTKGMGTR